MIKRILVLFVICFFSAITGIQAWNTPGSKQIRGYLVVNGKQAGMVTSYFADMARPSGYTRHDAAHAYILERAIEILRKDNLQNWADMTASYLSHLTSGSRHADAYKGRILIRLELEVLWGLITAESWEWDLTCAGGCEHYHNCDKNEGLDLTAWSILADAADYLVKIITLFGPRNWTFGLVDLDVDVIPDIKAHYPSGAHLCQLHYDNAVKAWNLTLKWPQRTYLESAMYELGWACHLIQDLTVAQHLHNMFIGGHADYEDFGDGKGDIERFHAKSAKNVYLHNRKGAASGMSAKQLALEVAKNMYYHQPGHLKKAEEGGDGERGQALEVAMKKAEQYTAALLAKFFQQMNIPPRVPPLKGWVRVSGSGATIPGAYVFYAPVGSTIQIEQNLTPKEKAALTRWDGWNYVRTDKNGHYKIPVQRFTKYWLRAAMPGYSFRGKTSRNLEFGKKECPVVYRQAAGVYSGGSIDFFLEALPKMVMVQPIKTGNLILAHTLDRSTLMGRRPQFIAAGVPLTKSGQKISPALSRTLYQGLIKVKSNDGVLGTHQGQTGLPEETVVILRIGKLISIPQAKIVASNNEVIRTIDLVQQHMKKLKPIPKLAVNKPILQTANLAGMQLMDKSKFLAIKKFLPKKVIHEPGKGKRTIIRPAAFFEGRDTAFKLMENGLIPVPAREGVVVEVAAETGPGMLDVQGKPIRITTNKDGNCAFKIQAGSHGGTLRFTFRVVKNPEALQIKPSGTVEIMVKPAKKAMDPIPEKLTRISPWIVPQIIEGATILGGDKPTQAKVLKTTLKIGPQGVTEMRTGQMKKIPLQQVQPRQTFEPEERPVEEMRERPVANFENPTLAGWEFIGGARIAPVAEGKALTMPQPGIAVWHRIQVENCIMRLRYRHGRGVSAIHLRMSGEPPRDQYYSLRFTPEEVLIIKRANNREQPLAQRRYPFETGSWYNLAVEMTGNQLVLRMNHQEMVRAHDPAPLSGGTLAFACLEGGGFAFDNISINMSEREAPSETEGRPEDKREPMREGDRPPEPERERHPEREEGPSANVRISGEWHSNIGRIYLITQEGRHFNWRVGRTEERGEGTIEGKRLSASWQGPRGKGRATGTIVRISPDGRVLRIRWSNGVVFYRE